MEIWDTYDTNRIKRKEKMIRGEAFDNGQLHLIVHLCLFDSNGRMLIQQRQSDKIGWADRWDLTVGGSALSGETSQTALQREAFEELGLELSLDSSRPHLTINYAHGFDDIYLIEKDLDADQLSLQKEEVQAVKWATKKEILAFIDEDLFIPYYKSFIEFIFESRHQFGVIPKEI
ncbi:MAG: NUDIX domain-containing protein [Alkalibacterium sp.]|nr:NUDIX domain-containing protein [Alkalibacterium sp.]